MTSRAAPVEAEGDSIDEAIAAALLELDLPRDRVRVEIVRDARKGLLGFGTQKARVRVSARDLPDAVLSASAMIIAAASELTGDEVLRRLLALMQIPATVERGAAEDPGQVYLRITSEAGGLLIGRRGQTLDAIEYLVNRIAGPTEDRTPRYLVDVGGYRERRTEELRESARRLAARVRSSGRQQTMQPMSARERRVVHVALKSDEAVTTRSVGDGPLRHVVIEPIDSPARR